jgi:hypothetical protein
VWPDVVVLHPPRLDHHARLIAISEPFEVEALFAETPIEVLVRPVLPGLTRIDVSAVDLLGNQPTEDGAGCAPPNSRG